MPVPIRRLPVWAGALACMVLIGEILLRQPGLLERLPPPERYLWHATNVQPKLDALDALERSRGVDVIFLGNSTVLAGIDPRDFDAARGHGSDARASYNGALQALPAAAVREFAEVFADRARPDAMIYGLTPRTSTGTALPVATSPNASRKRRPWWPPRPTVPSAGPRGS